MADKEEKKEVTEEKPAKPAPGKSKLPLMLGGGILIIVVLIVGGIFAMKSFTALSNAAGEEKPATENENPDGESIPTSSGVFYKDFQPFITVLEPSKEYNFTYLKFVPELELSDEKAIEEVTAKLPVLSAAINAVMTDLNWNTIKSEKGRERLSEKLVEKLNENLEEAKIINVYFTTFVVQ